MRQGTIALLLTLSVLLSGCQGLGGSYVSITPHQEQRQGFQTEAVAVSDYAQLCKALEEIVFSGTTKATIQMASYEDGSMEEALTRASRYIRRDYPIGAYAVKKITCELGTSAGQPAASVMVEYHHGRSELLRVRTVLSSAEAEKVVTNALARFDGTMVLQALFPEEQDFAQVVQDYAQEHPQTVMELPQVTQTVYGTGDRRVVELIFTYQNDRDALRRMQSQVKPVFDSAVLYVSGDDAQQQKFAQLYAFLMERFDYKIETSITPTYSLLRHGVGDSRAFATVYAAMCRDAGLECTVVTGTREGEPWVWNMVSQDGCYYHVDLIRSAESGGYHPRTDEEMEGYVWDYSAYPECNIALPET